MTEALAAISHRRTTKELRSAMRHSLRRCTIGVFVLVLAGLPVSGLAAPAISRADDCASGWVLEPRLESMCVLASGRKWTRRTRWARWARWARWTRPALDVSYACQAVLVVGLPSLRQPNARAGGVVTTRPQGEALRDCVASRGC
jgi:hypothetical protein